LCVCFLEKLNRKFLTAFLSWCVVGASKTHMKKSSQSFPPRFEYFDKFHLKNEYLSNIFSTAKIVIRRLVLLQDFCKYCMKIVSIFFGG